MRRLQQHFGPIGLAVEPVGGGKVISFGALKTAVAWSTIKVPLAIATVRAENGNPTPATIALIHRAITISDNSAAQSLWDHLGSATSASAQIESVLRETGDQFTTVPTVAYRPGYTVFGQTQWSMSLAATFAARLPCLPDSRLVRNEMGQIISSQRVGLGTLSNAIFKGGWGPGIDGHYLVRQIGVLTLPTRSQIGVALAVTPYSGSFMDANFMVNRIAQWLQTMGIRMQGGRC